MSGNPLNKSCWNHKRDSSNSTIFVDDGGNDISNGGRETKFPINNFSISVSNDLANNYRSSGSGATAASEWVFGQTEWSRLWAHRCFQSVAPAENPKETNLSPSVPKSFHPHSPLPRRGNNQNQNQPAWVTRLSCWVSIKSRLGNGGGPMRHVI